MTFDPDEFRSELMQALERRRKHRRRTAAGDARPSGEIWILEVIIASMDAALAEKAR